LVRKANVSERAGLVAPENDVAGAGYVLRGTVVAEAATFNRQIVVDDEIARDHWPNEPAAQSPVRV